MKVNEIYEKKKQEGKPVFSFEVFPPKKPENLPKVYEKVDELAKIGPDYISVTYGADGGPRGRMTSDIAGNIKKKYGIVTAAHLTCINSTIDEIEQAIGWIKENGIENVLVLRGDRVEGASEGAFKHASELAVKLQKSGDLNLMGACYPEGHEDSPNLEEDVENLKYKIGAGVTSLVTQLFFDNQVYYDFIDRVRAAGISVPVAAGIMPITRQAQIEHTVDLSGAKLPEEFSEMLAKYRNDPDELFEHGVEYAVKQIRDLIAHGAPDIHLYTMNSPEVVREVYDGIKDLL